MGAIGIELGKRRPDRPQSSGSRAARGARSGATAAAQRDDTSVKSRRVMKRRFRHSLSFRSEKECQRFSTGDLGHL